MDTEFDIELVDKLFEKSRESLKLVSNSKLIPDEWLDMSIENRLYTYAYYKQATRGKCETVQPEWWNSAGRYKWSAWQKLGDMTMLDAKLNYIKTTLLILKPLKMLTIQDLQNGTEGKVSNMGERLELQAVIEQLLMIYDQM